MKFAYYHFVFLQAVCGLLRRWGILKWDVRGIADLPPAGTPFVLVVNHIKWHDILVVAGSIPLTHIPYWLAKAELFTHLCYMMWIIVVQAFIRYHAENKLFKQAHVTLTLNPATLTL